MIEKVTGDFRRGQSGMGCGIVSGLWYKGECSTNATSFDSPRQQVGGWILYIQIRPIPSDTVTLDRTVAFRARLRQPDRHCLIDIA
jgi:hypothetical protein